MTPFDELTELRSVLTAGDRRGHRAPSRDPLPGPARQSLPAAYREGARRSLRGRHPAEADDGRRPAISPRSCVDHRRPSRSARSPNCCKRGGSKEVLEHLDPPEPDPTTAEQLKSIRFDPETLAQLRPAPTDDDPRVRAKLAEEERRVAALLDADPELASRLPAIEARIREHFGADAEIRAPVIAEYDDARKGATVSTSACAPACLSTRRSNAWASFSSSRRDLLAPVRERLTIGFL